MRRMRYIITGASRGLGLEFVRQLLSRGDSVDAGVLVLEEAPELLALAREEGGRLRVHPLDVADARSVSAFAEAVEDGRPVDVLIHNAGVFGQQVRLEGLDFEDLARTYSVNALGPLRVTAALLPALRRGSVRRIVHLTSRAGSLGDNGSGGHYAYRMSKAALNMAMRNLHWELRGEGFVTVVLHPGWARTEMGGPEAPLLPEESVRGLLQRIDGLREEHGGRVFDYQGQELPW